MKIRVEISSKWIFEHKGEVMPVTKLIAYLKEKFGESLSYEEKSFSLFNICVNDSNVVSRAILQGICEFFNEEYGIQDISSIINVSVSEEKASENLIGKTKATDRSEGIDEEVTLLKKATPRVREQENLGEEGMVLEKRDSSSEEEPLEDDGTLLKKRVSTGKDESSSLNAGANEPESSLDQIVAKVNDMIGCDQFKELINELVMVAPLIKENKTIDCLNTQNYLFAINEGYGLTTALNYFALVLKGTGLKNIADGAVFEFKIENIPSRNDSIDPFAKPLELLNLMREHKDIEVLICLDISEWMNDLNNRYLKNFLLASRPFQERLTIVYRIPFLNEEVYSRIKSTLADTTYVRAITFPTLSMDELCLYAKKELAQYGFEMSEDAWQNYTARILEEKKDGRFYGYSTVKKIVYEIIYNKQLTCAKNKTSTKIISCEDTSSLCTKKVEREIGMETLQKMVGGEKIKKKIEEIVAQIEIARTTGQTPPCIHMRFVGNPGTGKTTVARIIGKVLKEKGVLRLGNFFEYQGRDFCGRYVGETAPKTSAICRDAYGSILFIDEAYSLYRGNANDNDFGREALDTLIAEMENNRSDLLVIMAGYPNEMETLMEGNPGLASRMPYILEFPNFTREELIQIFSGMIKAPYVAGEGLLEKVSEYFTAIPDAVINAKSFSNARFARNLFERTLAKTATRLRNLAGEQIVITKEDFELASTDKEFKTLETQKRKIGFR